MKSKFYTDVFDVMTFMCLLLFVCVFVTQRAWPAMFMTLMIDLGPQVSMVWFYPGIEGTIAIPCSQIEIPYELNP